MNAENRYFIPTLWNVPRIPIRSVFLLTATRLALVLAVPVRPDVQAT